MKKIITTLTAVTFALGLAAAAQAQVAKTPEKPAVQSTQTTVQPQVAPKDAAKPVAKETVTTGDKTQQDGAIRGQRQGQERRQEGSPEGQEREESRRSRGKDPRGREVIPGRQKLCRYLTQTTNRA